jgi:flavorubredoxin
MEKVYEVMKDVSVIPTHVPIPNMGLLPVNAYVIKSREPVLIDSGTTNQSDDFMTALESVIDLKDLKWVWLTHDDADHTGSIQKVIETAPQARLVANALTILRMSTVWPVPMDRVYWINPGASIDVGDRRLIAVRPSLYDNPASIGVFDEKTEIYFSVDCFGGIMPSKAENTGEIPKEALEQGMLVWAGADSPWAHMIEQNQFSQVLDRVRQMAPKAILSSHLPSAQGMTEQFLELLAKVPSSTPFVAPDQTALEQILMQMKAGN